jgi:universal stress protein A
MLSIRTILHPTDFNTTSSNALRLACALASDYDAKLVIVHVIAAPLIRPDGANFSSPQRANGELREKLDHLEIPNDGIGVIRQLEEGNPASEILNLAQLCHADLIVMGSHRRHGLTRWLMGSVAEAVMCKATCPVLIVSCPVSRSAPSWRQDRREDVTCQPTLDR